MEEVMTKNKLTGFYKTAALAMKRLKEKFAHLEELMHNPKALFELKCLEAQYFLEHNCSEKEGDFNEIDVIHNELQKRLKERFAKDEVNELIRDNEDVREVRNLYYFFKEEAEYMLPLTRGAIEVFIRDNKKDYIECIEENAENA